MAGDDRDRGSDRTGGLSGGGRRPDGGTRTGDDASAGEDAPRGDAGNADGFEVGIGELQWLDENGNPTDPPADSSDDDFDVDEFDDPDNPTEPGNADGFEVGIGELQWLDENGNPTDPPADGPDAGDDLDEDPYALEPFDEREADAEREREERLKDWIKNHPPRDDELDPGPPTPEEIEAWIASRPDDEGDPDEEPPPPPPSTQEIEDWIASLPEPSETDPDEEPPPPPPTVQEIEDWIASLPDPSETDPDEEPPPPPPRDDDPEAAAADPEIEVPPELGAALQEVLQGLKPFGRPLPTNTPVDLDKIIESLKDPSVLPPGDVTLDPVVKLPGGIDFGKIVKDLQVERPDLDIGALLGLPGSPGGPGSGPGGAQTGTTSGGPQGGGSSGSSSAGLPGDDGRDHQYDAAGMPGSSDPAGAGTPGASDTGGGSGWGDAADNLGPGTSGDSNDPVGEGGSRGDGDTGTDGLGWPGSVGTSSNGVGNSPGGKPGGGTTNNGGTITVNDETNAYGTSGQQGSDGYDTDTDNDSSDTDTDSDTDTGDNDSAGGGQGSSGGGSSGDWYTVDSGPVPDTGWLGAIAHTGGNLDHLTVVGGAVLDERFTNTGQGGGDTFDPSNTVVHDPLTPIVNPGDGDGGYGGGYVPDFNGPGPNPGNTNFDQTPLEPIVWDGPTDDGTHFAAGTALHNGGDALDADGHLDLDDGALGFDTGPLP